MEKEKALAHKYLCRKAGSMLYQLPVGGVFLQLSTRGLRFL
jgi:hypothetical protein